MSTRRPTVNTHTAVAYLRVSTDDQKLGLDAQRAMVASWAAREGVSVVAWFTDELSGGLDLADRPSLLAALAALRAEGAGVLIVAKRDRLARDVVGAALVERAAASVGARVQSATGEGNGDSPADAFMRTVVDGAAQYERALIRGRTKAALAAKRAKGERAGTVPFGYAADADGRLTPDAGEQEVIAAVRDLRAAGTTLRGVVAALAARRMVSRAGTHFGLTQVARIAAAS
jgi:DNA invertase Pin-like site-specific DNA recombinase